MTLIRTVKQALRSRGLVDNLDLSHKLSIIHCDSQSAIHLIKNQVYHEKTKHIDACIISF